MPNNYNDITNKSKKYILGYTGYIPGLNFRYGKSYGKAADDSINEFTEKQVELKRKKDIEKRYTRSRSAPKMEPIHNRDVIKSSLKQFEEKVKFKGMKHSMYL